MFVRDDAEALAKPKIVIGLMSGTSVDAVDACCVKLSMVDGKLQHEILGTHTQAMPVNIRKRLLKCMNNEPVALKEISSLNTAVGQSFVDAAYGVMQASGLKRDQVDLIGSHGQTIFHYPPPGEGIIGHTFQIGEPAVIAEYTGVPVVGDFRPRDMALGGQGAPLVPFADKLLFQHEATGRCVQNIGGMANVTVLPPAGSEKSIIAFDTGPGNVLIDSAMDILFGKALDEDGAIAKSGTVNNTLLGELMGEPYLTEPPPKSTGRELFGRAYTEALITKHAAISKEDMVATLTAYTVASIADAYERFVFPHCDVKEMIVGGGGVKNPVLMDGLKTKLKNLTVKTHADYGVPDQYKEALAFAILGWSTMAGIPNNIPSCTGARHASVLGKIIF